MDYSNFEQEILQSVDQTIKDHEKQKVFTFVKLFDQFRAQVTLLTEYSEITISQTSKGSEN